MSEVMQPTLKIVEAFTKSGLFVEIIKQTQKESFKNILAAVNNNILFPNFDAEVIEGNIIKEESQQTTKIISLPSQAIQVQRLLPVLKSPTGIALFPYGGFIYKRKVLRYFSKYNQAGKLLQLFLSHFPHVLTHENIIDAFHIKEEGKHDAQKISYIIRSFKRAFKANGLEVFLNCERTVGYTLAGVKSLPL
jgi:hypothetical protein